MPKDKIAYSNTIIYKIYCKDENIKHLYVGHTTNFTQRKYEHKKDCNSLNNKLKLYNVIRSNGGWENWDMIEIGKYNCKNHTEARIKEQEHYQQLKCTLNSKPPYIDKQQYYCGVCKLQCSSLTQLNNHNESNKHKSNLSFGFKQDTDNTKKTPEKFICEECEFKCCKLSDWNRHISRPKHLNNQKGYTISTNDTNKTPKTPEYVCACGKNYQYNSGLWRHKKQCSGPNVEIQSTNTNTQLTPDLVMKLIEQNKELQQTVIEQNKTIVELAQKAGSYNTTNTNCGNNNKTFNLQVFLNETCKDAINMSDFINQIQVSLSELEDTGKLGYAEGISKVFIKNLNDINDTERPLHCSDSKREIIYIKENNQWTKDDENKTSLTKAIKQVANKNIKQISEWQKVHPNYSDPESKDNDKYMKIILNSMSGSTKEESEKNYEKIAKNIAKEVVINKTNY
jgi:hypothetical protein